MQPLLAKRPASSLVENTTDRQVNSVCRKVNSNS